MDTSKNKLFLVITLFNIIVTVLMVVFFINIDKVFTKSMKKNTEIYVGAGGPEYLGRSETSSTKSDDSIIASKPLDYIDRSDWTSTYDDAALRLLHDRLENKSFYVSDSIIFSFGLSNMFSGFFDSNNSNVSGYTYELLCQDELRILSIYNNDRSVVVSYYISINNSNNIELKYTKASVVFELKER